MKTETIEIVNRGRGPQLSTSRVTVQDLVPYFQDGDTYDEIVRWIPGLTFDEFNIVERYYREHQVELDEEDGRIRDYVAAKIREQRKRFPEEPRESRLARIKETLRQRQKEQGDEGDSR